MSDRNRSTWSRAAATNRQADPFTMNQTRVQPSEDAYANGDPSTWGEDVDHSNMWKNETRNEIGQPVPHSSVIDSALQVEEAARVAAQKAAATPPPVDPTIFQYHLKRAKLATMIAESMLPGGAPDEVVVASAGHLMYLPDAALAGLREVQRNAGLVKYAGEEAPAPAPAPEAAAPAPEAAAPAPAPAPAPVNASMDFDAELEAALFAGSEEGQSPDDIELPSCDMGLEDPAEGVDPVIASLFEQALPAPVTRAASVSRTASQQHPHQPATPQRLGAAPRARVASVDPNRASADLSALWSSEPDVSAHFGTPISVKD